MPFPPGAQGSRLPIVAYQALIPRRQGLSDKMASTVIPWADRSTFRAQDGDGRFIGPFNPALLHPELAQSFLELQFAEAEHSVLADRVCQEIILTVGSVWHADHELYAQSGVARHAGLAEDVVSSLAAGETPDGLLPEELLAHRVAPQLAGERQVDDSFYHLAEERFRRQGVLDLVILVGIYQTVCGLLNAFGIPAPTQDHDDEGPSRRR